MIYQDRSEAGELLAKALKQYSQDPDAIVIALPRGGVVTGYYVAKRLGIPLDVTCPKKIGSPDNPEYAIGAVTESGQGFINRGEVYNLGVSEEYLRQTMEDNQRLMQQRSALYRQGRPAINLAEKTVLLVDDGLATGFTMFAAIESIRQSTPQRIVVAVPVGPPETVAALEGLVDEVICLEQPPYFHAVGQFYRQFDQTDDQEVISLLAASLYS